MHAAEEWSRVGGCTALGSDPEEVNHLGRAAHAALGFEAVETRVMFRKSLSVDGDTVRNAAWRPRGG